MYKAIKDNKIIAISDIDSEFPCMIKDEVVEDVEHTTSDYEQYRGEFLLKTEIPAPTEEEQRAKREAAYQIEADPLRYDYEEDAARYGYNSEEAEETKQLWLDKKDEIRERYPYPVGE